MHALLAPDTKVRDFVLYSLSDPDSGEVRYVGKTDNLQRRYTNHLSPATLNRNRSKKNSWIKSLLAKGKLPKIQVIDSGVSAEDIDEAERFWISVYRGWGVRLTNGTDGGDGGAIRDPDALARIRAAHVGSKHSEATKALMSASHKALITPEERERLRSISNGKPPVHLGEKNSASRFTEVQVIEIREAHAAGEDLGSLAKRFETSKTQIFCIVTGKTWKHVGGPIRVARVKQRLSQEDVDEIRRLVAGGCSQGIVAESFGIDRSHVSKIVHGRARKPRPE